MAATLASLPATARGPPPAAGPHREEAVIRPSAIPRAGRARKEPMVLTRSLRRVKTLLVALGLCSAIFVLAPTPVAAGHFGYCGHGAKAYYHPNAIVDAIYQRGWNAYAGSTLTHYHRYKYHYYYPIGQQSITEYGSKPCAMH
jgi:hypothetical protein